MTLPLHEEAAVADSAPPRSARPGLPPPPGSLRVLLVDDNADAVQLMHEALVSHGFEVASTQSPVEALRLAPRFRPDVAVLDIGLPVMDGYELARELRQLSFAPDRLSLIALTGYGQPRDRVRAVESGFDLHFVKPIHPAALVEALGTLCPQKVGDGLLTSLRQGLPRIA